MIKLGEGAIVALGLHTGLRYHWVVGSNREHCYFHIKEHQSSAE